MFGIYAALFSDRRFLSSGVGDQAVCELVVVVEDVQFSGEIVEEISCGQQDGSASMFCVSYSVYQEQKPVISKLVPLAEGVLWTSFAMSGIEFCVPHA